MRNTVRIEMAEALQATGNVCSTIGCGKPATLQCPTCLKLGIKGSFFCAQVGTGRSLPALRESQIVQDCFKSSWKAHKVVHQRTSAGLTIPPLLVVSPPSPSLQAAPTPPTTLGPGLSSLALSDLLH